MAQQENQPAVYTNVVGPRDWLLFQGPDILTPQSMPLQCGYCYHKHFSTFAGTSEFFSPLTVKGTFSMYITHSTLTEWVKFPFTTK